MNDDCLKLTTYFGDRQRTDGRFLGDAILDLYGQHNIAASIMLRGSGGFGLRHHLRTDEQLSLSEDLPVAVIAVDTTHASQACSTR
jgi:PII-like signaling protein